MYIILLRLFNQNMFKLGKPFKYPGCGKHHNDRKYPGGKKHLTGRELLIGREHLTGREQFTGRKILIYRKHRLTLYLAYGSRVVEVELKLNVCLVLLQFYQ